jgi:hypothetical protein
MAFTWTGDPNASTIEQIRWEIYDIDSTQAKFADAEIQYAYDQEHSILGAAARLCEQLQVRYCGAANRSMGPLRVQLNELAQTYRSKAKDLRMRSIKYAYPYVGGISDAKKDTFEDDSDLIQPNFEVGMMDNE